MKNWKIHLIWCSLLTQRQFRVMPWLVFSFDFSAEIHKKPNEVIKLHFIFFRSRYVYTDGAKITQKISK